MLAVSLAASGLFSLRDLLYFSTKSAATDVVLLTVDP